MKVWLILAIGLAIAIVGPGVWATNVGFEKSARPEQMAAYLGQPDWLQFRLKVK